MAFEHEQREALHLLQGIENGTMSISEAAHLIDEADPALVYLLLTWLRSHYGGDHPAAEGVIGRLVELTGKHAGVKASMREGKADSIVAWFEEEHSYREFSATGFVALVVEKLEG
ncbi:MAG: hypothetical protein DRJ42_25855 [Deltaproteobacteria bacterium]|nr:MAG: hypothetical protein DRJ42_25855 [Deltaproteobacteria bacterium]